MSNEKVMDAKVTVGEGFLFPLGDVYITPAIKNAIPSKYAAFCTLLHSKGHWVYVPDEDKLANLEAVENGGRIISSYPLNPHEEDNGKFWIITEADRSSTTLLMPDEY